MHINLGWTGVQLLPDRLVKMERIRSNSGETMSVTIFFLDSESKRIVLGFKYGIGTWQLRIWSKYGSNKVWLQIDILSDVVLKIGLIYIAHFMDQCARDKPIT